MRDPEKEQQLLALVEQVNAEGPYKPEWASLMGAKVPDWFRQRKLGIFLHWGVYTVPAKFHEWYPRNMYIQNTPEWQYHRDTYGPDFGYQDFIPMFRAEKFDPDAWMRLFREAGAGYVFPVAEHHDGFQMYASELSDWNAAEMGPKRDVLGELKQAAQAQGLELCASSHRAEHWFFMSHGREYESDVREPMQKGDFYWPAMTERGHQELESEPAPSEEFLNDWLARTAEIIVNYQPSLLYFDWWIQHAAFKPYLKKLAAFYYNCGVRWGKDVQVCYKHDAMMFGTGLVEIERGSFSEAKPFPWQTDTAVARNSWCYTDSLDYKTPREIITTLVDVVSKGGNLLLNIGPKSDGTIPEGDERILRELAGWMKVNSEAIDSARPWRHSQEGPTVHEEGQFQDGAETIYTSADYRFTAANGAIYAIALACPEDGQFTIISLGDSADPTRPNFHGILKQVSILGYTGQLTWHKDARGLHISAPGLCSEYPVVIKAEPI